MSDSATQRFSAREQRVFYAVVLVFILAVYAGLAFAMVSWSHSIAAKNDAFAVRGVTTYGTVEAFVANGRSYDAVVRYETPDGTKKVRMTEYQPDAYPVNGPVRITYLPGTDEVRQEGVDSPELIVPIYVGVVGAVLWSALAVPFAIAARPGSPSWRDEDDAT